MTLPKPLRLSLPWLMVIVIGVLSLLPSDSFPKTDVPFSDKIVHALMYGALALSYYIAHTQWRHVFWLMVLLPSFWGILFEVLQNYVPSRSMTYWDAVANVLGASCMTLVVYLWSRRKSHVCPTE